MKVFVLGSGISGKSALKFLLEKGYSAEFLDEKYINEKYDDYDRLLSDLSFIVVSPGISHDCPIIVEAKKRGIKVTGELELGTNATKGDIIAITGTNGKTTTVSLIYHILKNKNVFIGGNIGIPVTSFACKTNEKSISILECSSFQLEDINNFSPRIAAILNIDEDHLNRHKTMENYIKAKLNITKNQTENDYLLLNADCKILMQNIPKTNAKILYFSTKKPVFGCFIKDESIYFKDNKIEKKLISLNSIKLIGEHNLSNILCGVLAVYLETKNIKKLKKINNFYGIEHRIEFVMSVGGVKFYNDSKATNTNSTIVATKCFKEPINLIMGGSDKGYSFDEIFAKLPKNVKNIAIFGETKQKIAFSAKKYGYKNIFIFNDLKSCVIKCYELSKSGFIVLLSPACASFDQFSSYKERGNIFKKIVKELASNENVISETDKEKKL